MASSFSRSTSLAVTSWPSVEVGFGDQKITPWSGSESVGGDPDRAAFWAGLTEHQSSPRVREPLAVAGGGCQCPVDVPGTLPGEGVLHRRARQRCSEVSTGQFP